jgi:cytochrome c biogenesis factor
MLDIWKLVRIWILISWSFLTVGILLGSWWAYHELGWGGWWFWDPVENASLMPWLLATAGIHSITKRSSSLLFLTIICTQGTFILSILGTFFVRSGLLSSVHSFATDSTRGLYLFIFFLLITVISVFNWCEIWCRVAAANASLPASAAFARKKATQSRLKQSIEQILYLQNFYFCVICIVVFCGTSSPIFYQWFWNRDVGTGAPFYNGTLIPLFTSVFLVLVYAHYLQFDRSNKKVTPVGDSHASVAKRQYAQHVWDAPCFAPEAGVRSMTALVRDNVSNSYAGRWRVWCLINSALNAARHELGRSSGGYCFFFFALHVICFHFIIGLDFLNSIYGAFCVLLISSIFLSSFLWPRAVTPFRPLAGTRNQNLGRDHGREASSLANRHIVSRSSTDAPIQLEAACGSGGSNNSRFAPLRASLMIAKSRSDNQPQLRPPIINDPLRFAPQQGRSIIVSRREAQWVELMQNAVRMKVLSDAEGAQLSEMKIAHTGIVFFITGILLSNTFKFQFTEQLHSGSMIRLGSQICCLRSIDHSFAPTFHSICANLIVSQQPSFDFLTMLRTYPLGRRIAPVCVVLPQAASCQPEQMRLAQSGINAGSNSVLQHSKEAQSFYAEAALCLFPEKRFYFSNPELTTTKVAIHSNLFTDIYGLIGTGSFETGWFTTIMRLPFIFCIWLGFLFGVIGGAKRLKKQLQKSKINWI